MFVNRMPRYEILSEDAIETLDRGWRRIVSARSASSSSCRRRSRCSPRPARRWTGDSVKLDPEFVLEQVAKAPREFDVQARNPEHSIHIGGDHMAFASVYGPPFVREGDDRRDATMQDFERFTMLSQTFDELDSAGGTICEPNDRPLDSRHLDMVFALQTLTDKPYMGSVTSGPERGRHGAHDRDAAGRPRVDRGNAGRDLADQHQLAASVRRPHAGGDVRVRARRPAGGDHAVPADGRDVAGVDPGNAGAADGRGAGRDRAGPAGAAGHAGDLRLVPVEHRHAVGVAQLRHAGVGARPVLHRPDRPPFRPALALGRRLHVKPDGGRTGRHTRR